MLQVYFSMTSFQDQKEYIRLVTKPFRMTCEALAARLCVISQLLKHLPGSVGAELLDGKNTKKRDAYFQLMSFAWRVKFAESGHAIDGATYSLTSLTHFMVVQETSSKQNVSCKGACWHWQHSSPSRVLKTATYRLPIACNAA